MNYVRNQRGVAFILELVAVAVVLVVVGFAVYNAVSNRQTAKDTSPAGLAATAGSIADQDATADADVSTAADSISGQVLAADADLSDLGGTSDVDF